MFNNWLPSPLQTLGVGLADFEGGNILNIPTMANFKLAMAQQAACKIPESLLLALMSD